MYRVAIVGCGVFGATIGLRLQRDGHSVTIFERLSSPINGASYNNQNRLHLGYHYPRDIETAQQCIKGFADFKATFSECIVSDFPNAYFVAEEKSKTSANAYLNFCKLLGLDHSIFDPATFKPDVKNVSLGVLTQEVVYDSVRLGKHLEDLLKNSRTNLRLGTEVKDIARDAEQFSLSLESGEVAKFDVVVNATYANNSNLVGSLGLQLEDRQFEYTVVPIIRAPFSRTGITIMDGSFMTVLPFGSSENHLLYHVEHTVIERSVAPRLDPSWLNKSTSPFSNIDPDRLFDDIRNAASFFVPALRQAELVGFLQGPRMVLARRDDTDARPSIIENPVSGYYSVFSGKIDHCMWVAQDIGDRIRGQ